MGGILSGIFTATESAAIACLWAFFVTMFIYRDYKWSELPKLMFRTVKTVTIVMILIGFAAALHDNPVRRVVATQYQGDADQTIIASHCQFRCPAVLGGKK